MNKLNLSMVCAAACLVAACGGSSGGAAPATPPAATDAVPASASQSAAGMNAWLSDLAQDPTEVKEGLDVASFAPPSPDDTEPQTLN